MSKSSTLPTQRPKWYDVQATNDGREEYRGWTPQTSDIVAAKKENHDVVYAWNGDYSPHPAKDYTVKLDRLKVISPIQIGGDSFFEGGTLPAQVGGVPWIPGSSVRGALLNWLHQQWVNLKTEEQRFWLTLMSSDRKSWQPKKIRFESVLLKELRPFPLNPQQKWQVFDDPKSRKKLGIQWQVAPKHPPNPYAADKFTLQVLLKDSPTEEEKKFLETALVTMLEEQGVGRGTKSGFGRLAQKVPSGKWEIKLEGMKPCYQVHNNSENITGKYRWSPQVLRASLRGYFLRLALRILEKKDAQKLTSTIFGELKSPARLVLTSYLKPISRQNFGTKSDRNYGNMPAKEPHEVWLIDVDCNSPFQDLIGHLLELASRLGGLGPGWRRPPHVMSHNVFRGSQFSYTPDFSNLNLSDLIAHLLSLLKELARQNNLALLSPVEPSKINSSPRAARELIKGALLSIWQGKKEQWREIVHGVCSTSKGADKPGWCGSTNERTSGYAVREYEDYCLISVFDSEVEGTLQDEEFEKIWSG